MNEVLHYRPIDFHDDPPHQWTREQAIDRLTAALQQLG